MITFIILTGKVPFKGKTKYDILNAAKTGKYVYPDDCDKSLTDNAKDFVANLLKLDTTKRMSCNDALNHEWLNKWDVETKGIEF